MLQSPAVRDGDYGWTVRGLPCSEVLQSEFLNQSRNSIEEREAALRLREEIEEQDLQLNFLLQLQKRKQDIADNLQDTVAFLSSDINVVITENGMDNANNQFSRLEDVLQDDERIQYHNDYMSSLLDAKHNVTPANTFHFS